MGRGRLDLGHTISISDDTSTNRNFTKGNKEEDENGMRDCCNGISDTTVLYLLARNIVCKENREEDNIQQSWVNVALSKECKEENADRHEEGVKVNNV